MWVEETEELFKGYLPYYILIMLPMFIIIMPANPVAASYEFPVYRMQHFDLHGTALGCRSASINLEARSLASWTTSRHCVLAKIQDLTVDHFRNIRSRAGALLIMIPENLGELSDETKEHIAVLEEAMMVQEISIPVYFITWNSELDKILLEVENSFGTEDKSKPASEAILNSVAANGYQIVVNPKTPTPKQDIKIATLHGSLLGYNAEGKASTIVVVAHYDSFGVAPELSFGADSNASGVAMLLELMRLFSRLYSNPKTHGKFNLLFLLTGAGKLNYHGSKRWLEDQLESLDGSTSIQDPAYVLCLDTLLSSNSIYMHVSKPPKEGSAASVFFKELKKSAARFEGISVDGVHKKINLADDLLAWEHERYSIRRLPAFTLSSLKSHKDSARASILDVYKSVNIERLVQNTQIVAEAIASHIYNVSGGEIFQGSMKVEQEHLEAWMNFLTNQPRSTQLISTKDSSFMHSLEEAFNRYVRDVKTSNVVPDRRDPDFVFYDVTKSVVNVYNVKPAIFDLVLTVLILLYLGGVYLIIQKFPAIYQLACTFTSTKAKIN